MRRYFILTTKKCRIYAAFGVSQTPIKYNKEKGEILLSYYETQVDDRHILFEFQCKDTGVGMSKEFQNHIFEPFTQETGGARSVYGGTGLGMPITKKLIEKMGGTIKFE